MVFLIGKLILNIKPSLQKRVVHLPFRNVKSDKNTFQLKHVPILTPNIIPEIF